MIRMAIVDTSIKNVFYDRFINMIFYNFFVIISNSYQERHTFLSETIENNNTERIKLGYQNNEYNLRNESNFNGIVHSRCISFSYAIFYIVWYFLCLLGSKINYLHSYKRSNIFQRKCMAILFCMNNKCCFVLI